MEQGWLKHKDIRVELFIWLSIIPFLNLFLFTVTRLSVEKVDVFCCQDAGQIFDRLAQIYEEALTRQRSNCRRKFLQNLHQASDERPILQF